MAHACVSLKNAPIPSIKRVIAQCQTLGLAFAVAVALVCLTLAFSCSARAEAPGNGAREQEACIRESPTVRLMAFSQKRSKTALVESVSGTASRKLVLGALADSVTSLEETVDAQGKVHRENGVGTQVALPFGLWRVTFSDGTQATVASSMEISASSDDSTLRFLLEMPLEDYVARTVASETLPKTSPQALQAQAVVARSFAAHSQTRHGDEGAHLCDLAHCQVLSWSVIAAHFQAAQKAAQTTRGEVLVLPSDEAAPDFQKAVRDGVVPLVPLFHASCGGGTASPENVFDGLDVSGAFPVSESACALDRWRVKLPASQVRDVLKHHLGQTTSKANQNVFSGITFIRDGVGRVLQLKSANGRVLSGEAFVRHLGARVGYGKIPSAIFTVDSSSDSKNVIFRGRGKGHGVGMCQSGAAQMAKMGSTYRDILKRYFPQAKIVSMCAAPKEP